MDATVRKPSQGSKRTASRFDQAWLSLTSQHDQDAYASWVDIRPEDIDIATVAAHAPVEWAVTTIDGRHILCNEAYGDLFGRSVDELTGTHVGELLADSTEGVDYDIDCLEQLRVRGQAHHRSDHRYLRADGSEFTGLLRVNLLCDPGEAPIGVIRVVADVSRQRMKADELAHSQAHLTKMLRNISDTVTLIDSDARVLSTTGFHKEVLGYPREFWTANRIFDLAHPDDIAEAQDLAAQVLAEPGVEHATEIRARHASGHHETLEVSAVNLLDDPEVGAIVVTSRNVSDRKRVESELAVLRDEALALAQERANFVATVSHELRSPLHAVLGLSELLATRISDPEQHELLDGIRREAEQLRATVDDLLDYSRYESHGITIENGPVDVHALIERITGRARAAEHASELTVRSIIAENLPPVIEGDAYRLEQVLTNLMGNAVKYTRAGGVTIRAVSPATGRIAFEIADTGPGIPESHRELIFEPFVQVPGPSSARGTGLGLALVKALTELMHGRVTLECPASGGTVVTVDFPATPTPAESSARPITVGRPSAKGASVLVVEDNPVNQMLVRRQLERLGHRATIVSTAREGLDLLAESSHSHDLVLMDWQLPDIDGLEATRMLRRSERETGTHVPVVAMTASAMPEDRASCRAAGMDGFLAKPVGLRDLEDAIVRWARFGPSRSRPAREAAGGSFDPHALTTLLEDLGDHTIVLSLVEHYLAELDQREQAVCEAASSSSYDSLHRIGHTLRSTSEMMGVLEMRDLCRELEAVTGAADATELVERFASAAERTRDTLRAWIADQPQENP